MYLQCYKEQKKGAGGSDGLQGKEGIRYKEYDMQPPPTVLKLPTKLTLSIDYSIYSLPIYRPLVLYYVDPSHILYPILPPLPLYSSTPSEPPHPFLELAKRWWSSWQDILYWFSEYTCSLSPVFTITFTGTCTLVNGVPWGGTTTNVGNTRSVAELCVKYLLVCLHFYNTGKPW